MHHLCTCTCISKQIYTLLYICNIYVCVHVLLYNAWFLPCSGSSLMWASIHDHIYRYASHILLHVWQKMTVPYLYLYHRRLCQTPNIPVVTSTAHIHIFSDYLSSFLPQVPLPVRVSPILNPVVVLPRVPSLTPHTSFAHAAATCRHAFTGRRERYRPSERRAGRQDSFDSSMFQSKFIHCCITFICTYSTTIDSCRLDFFVDMEVREEPVNESTGTHLILCFMCDRKWLFNPSSFLPQVLLPVRVPPFLNPAVVLARVLFLQLIQVPVQEQDPPPTPALLMLLPLVGMHSQGEGGTTAPARGGQAEGGEEGEVLAIMGMVPM